MYIVVKIFFLGKDKVYFYYGGTTVFDRMFGMT
jgi:hypothetical protein